MREITLETKEVVVLEIDEFNELRKAEPFRRLLDKGFVDLNVVCWEKEIRLTLPGSTSMKDLISAASAILHPPDFGKPTEIRTADGVLLEQGRPLHEYKTWRYGERLFLG